jgi:hypothetical protein
MFNVSTLLLNDTNRSVMPFVNAAISEALPQFAQFFDNDLVELIDGTELPLVVDSFLKSVNASFGSGFVWKPFRDFMGTPLFLSATRARCKSNKKQRSSLLNLSIIKKIKNLFIKINLTT